MKKVLLTSTIAIALHWSVASLLAQAPDLNGQWSVHNSVAGNDSDQDCKFAVADGKLSGTCDSEGKQVQVTGSITGNNVSWSYQTDYEGSPLTVAYSATLDNADKISGSIDVQEYGVSGDFTAIRQKPSKQ
jgi:hypothetical protein